MEIVIKIPDKKYEALKMLESATIGLHLGVVEKAIINGTPLPKGHGALKDADTIWESLKEHKYSDDFCMEHNIDYSINLEMTGIVIEDAPTIIEADKEVEDGREDDR